MLDLLTRGAIANELIKYIPEHYDLNEPDERWQAEGDMVAAINLIVSSKSECRIDPNRSVAHLQWIEPTRGDFNDTRLNLLALIPNDLISGDVEMIGTYGTISIKL